MTSYRAILTTPGAMRVFVPSALGRTSLAMVTLSSVVLVADATGSYAVAGLASGALGMANVVAAPFRARYVDRVGQRTGLRLLSLGYAVGVAALVASTAWGAPDVLLVVLAALTGLSAPPVGAAMRMRWRLLVADPAQIQRAYSLDAVSEEIVFTLGPVVAGLVMAATVPAAGLVASAVLALVGCFLMTSRSTAPPGARTRRPAPVRAARRPQVLRVRGFVPVLVVTAATGVVVGSVSVVVPAQVAPDTTLAGILLAALALGSGIGGLTYGARDWRLPAPARLVGLAVAMAVACALLAVLPPVVLLALGLVLAGLALAPAMVSGYLVADVLTDEDVRMEAHTWVSTAVNAGEAVAFVVMGVVLDAATPAWAYGAGAALAAALVVLGAPAALRSSPAAPVSH
ncbi:MFS transporter [Cellulomonas edaphi]|uniref:MFS transporter n=1 Tax=Cellulomonas edaphi TaxID=3053468 RepID=A0ABT7S515_9CELL|nr:MFS transporter [Cellulomons edaphi]MDM7830714.1 MFS transporter [Cellulomons edaphi]